MVKKQCSSFSIGLRRAGATLVPVSTQVLHTLSAAAGNVYAAPHKAPPMSYKHILWRPSPDLRCRLRISPWPMMSWFSCLMEHKHRASRDDSPDCRCRWGCSRFSDSTLRGPSSTQSLSEEVTARYSAFPCTDSEHPELFRWLSEKRVQNDGRRSTPWKILESRKLERSGRYSSRA